MKNLKVLVLISVRFIVQKTGVFHTLYTDYSIKKVLSDMIFDVIYIQIIE